MMRIGIEAQRLFRKHKFGTDVAVQELIRHLQKIDQTNEYIIFVAPGASNSFDKTENFNICEINNNIYPVWEQFYLPKVAKSMKIDLLHSTSNTAPLYATIPFILTLHDTISLERTHSQKTKTWYQQFGNQYRRHLIPRIAPKSQCIITVSNIEKQNIIDMLKINPDKIKVVHNGVDQRFKNQRDEAFRKKYNLPEHYIAFIGNSDPRKNVANTLKAYDLYLKTSGLKTPLVMLHNNEHVFEQQLACNKLEYLKESIIMLGYIESAHMPAFYSLADMFLYPSEREGFGFPIIESMACGTPVITSNVSSMPEVGGDSALYVNPFDYKDIAQKMLYLERNPEKRNTLVESGLKRSKEFSWERAANDVLGVYKNVYEQLHS